MRAGFISLFLFTLLSFSSFVLCDLGGSDPINPNSDVHVLTDDNFYEVTSSGSWLLEFYAPCNINTQTQTFSSHK